MNIITKQLAGVLQRGYDDHWDTLHLVEPDGYKIDLMARFGEIKSSFPKSKIQVGYWVCPTQCTKDEAILSVLEKLYGVLSVEKEVNEYYYSSYTYGVDYDTTLQIGGHNLFHEMEDKNGKYVILEINIEV